MKDKILDPFINIGNKELPNADLLGLTSNVASQNLFGTLNVGNKNIKIDGANRRIIINDGTTNRIVIGNV